MSPLSSAFLCLVRTRVLWNLELRPVKQARRSSVKESYGCPKPEDAGVDGRSDWTLGGSPGAVSRVDELPQRAATTAFLTLCFAGFFFSDVRELWGERPGHMLHRPPADSVEERRKAVPPAQPGTFPKTRGEWRTLTSLILKMDRSPAVS